MSEKLWNILREAYEKIPYYISIRENKKLSMEKLMEKEWQSLPITEKNHIISGGNQILSPDMVGLLLRNELIHARTSGSTGNYMDIYWKNEDYMRSMMGLWYYRKKYYGIAPADKLCFFYTISSMGAEADCIRRKSELGFSKMNLTEERMREIYHQMCEFAPKWLLLQPSIAMLLCRCMDKYGLGGIKSVKYIEFTGELLTEEVKKYVRKHFECRIANQYGANEFNSIAYECPCGNLHIMRDNVYVEVLNDNGEICENGEEGELYITTLTNHAMPLIRYRIGDRGKMEQKENCSCGNRNSVLKLECGRSNDWIITENGEKITPNIFVKAFDCVDYYLDGVIKQFQVVQEDAGHILVYLVVDEEDLSLNQEIEKIFMESLCEERLNGVKFRFFYRKDLLPDTNTGKLRWFWRKEDEKNRVIFAGGESAGN